MGNDVQKGVEALLPIPKDSVILAFEQTFVQQPTNKTLRIDAHRHQLSTNTEAAENFINHSCEPNAYIAWNTLELKALRDIDVGEQITYNYFTSDLDEEDLFVCACNTPSCKKVINGFTHLPLGEKQKLKPYLSPFLQNMLEKEIE